MDIEKLIAELTLEEKVSLCEGADSWHTVPIERLGIPSVMVSDGPHGLRKQDVDNELAGAQDSITAVCFPAACATACSFDRELLEELGSTLGRECRSEGVAVILGPAVNIKRSPLCGRNFEYISEDPYLAGELASAYINGVQKEKVGTSIKHFAANNQEYCRLTSSSEVDERTLREIYFPAFETAVKKSNPWTFMCSYNRINGVHASENAWLLDTVLRKEWGYAGLVMSDWGAVNDRVRGLPAGVDLEMPGANRANNRRLVEAVQSGTIPMEALDEAVRRVLTLVQKGMEGGKTERFDRAADHEKAVKFAEECMVLLKNDGQLPLKTGEKVLFVGGFAKEPRFQGGGSSHINSYQVENAYDTAAEFAKVEYAKGFSATEDKYEEELAQEALVAAAKADKVVVFAGLPESIESEGFDRRDMKLPACQNRLIAELLEVNQNVTVVLHNGSPVELPWVERVPAILEAYLAGEGSGRAVADILYGKANPSAKLAETFPLKLSDNPSYLNFPGSRTKVEYREGLYVGYRYYDTKEQAVCFPFGHGLSYTSFAYTNFKLSSDTMQPGGQVTVSVDITNTGSMAGKEIVQLYVKDNTHSVMRPVKELKGFERVALEPGETKTVTFVLEERAFSWYNTDISDWYAADGAYTILVGRSSRDMAFAGNVTFTGARKLQLVIDANTCLSELNAFPALAEITRETLLPYLEKEELEKKRLEKRVKAGKAGSEPEPLTAKEEEAAKKAAADFMNMLMTWNDPLRTFRSFHAMSNEALDELIERLRNTPQSC